MPHFNNEKSKRGKRTQASNLTTLAMRAYAAAKEYSEAWSSYGGGDTDFNAAVEAAFGSTERTDLDGIAGLCDDLVSGMESSYSDFLSNA